jgi:Raf kinase inhibitor-like YbhB/YbcL family protein
MLPGSATGMAQELNVADLKVSSPAFGHHEPIPKRHSGDGEDVAPALEWSGVPDGTKAFAVVVDDPDAPLVNGFTHWVRYGIPGGLDRRALVDRIEDHVIEQARLVGTYTNKG